MEERNTNDGMNSIDLTKNSGSNSGNGQNNKYCKFCGKAVDVEAVLCIYCGRQIEELKSASSGNPNVIINNNNNNSSMNNSSYAGGEPKDKWVALMLCIFLGVLGIHKFYERKYIMGVIYLLTFGFMGIGPFIDFFIILCKPNPYY